MNLNMKKIFISWDKIWSVHVDEARSMVVRLELREEKGNGIELEKSNGGERESREKRDYRGERDVDFFFFLFRDRYEMY